MDRKGLKNKKGKGNIPKKNVWWKTQNEFVKTIINPIYPPMAFLFRSSNIHKNKGKIIPAMKERIKMEPEIMRVMKMKMRRKRKRIVYSHFVPLPSPHYGQKSNLGFQQPNYCVRNIHGHIDAKKHGGILEQPPYL